MHHHLAPHPVNPLDGSTAATPRVPHGPKPPGEWERADAMDVRCLDLCIGMLERINRVSNLHLLITCQPIDTTNPCISTSLTDIRRKLDFGGYPR
jgi:hypothetical protein